MADQDEQVVNTEVASTTPPESAEKPTGQQEASSQASAAVTAPEKKEPTLREVAQQAFDSATQAEKPVEEEEEGAVQKLDGTPEGEAAPKDGEQEQEVTSEDDEKGLEPDKPVPYDRFKQVIAKKNEFKGRAEEYEAKVKEYEPLAKAQEGIGKFCQEHAITPQQFQEALQFVALLNSDPVKARESLRPVWEQLGNFDPNVLPEDLATRVTEGEISEAAAKEIAAYRVKERQQASQGAVAKQTQQQQGLQEVETSITQWQQSKMKSDPDFKPKANGAQDGLFEWTAKGFTYLLNTKKPSNPAEVIKLLEQAFTEAKQVFKPKAPLVVNKPVLNSAKAAAEKQAEPKTIREVAMAAAAKHGIRL